MSSPINDDGSDDRLKYAPPWARQQGPPAAEMAPTAPPADAARPASGYEGEPPDPHRSGLDDGPAVAPPPVEHPSVWLRAPAKVFEGDVAIRELTRRMTLDPQFVPEPPVSSRRFSLRGIVRFLVVIGLAAAAAYALALFAVSDANHISVGTLSKGLSTPPLARPTTAPDGDPAGINPAPARLVLIESRHAAIDERVALGVTVTGAPGGGAVLVSGLAAGARLSAGMPLGDGSWRLRAPDLAQAEIETSHGFHGAMELSVELRSADDTVVERKMMRLEWGPAPAASAGHTGDVVEQWSRDNAAPVRPSEDRSVDRDELAMLVKRGREFIANGDLASARLVLRRAADGGDAQATLLLGSTYDPAVLSELKVIGAAPDPVQARLWYQRAAELGSREAVRRLEPLARGAP